MGSFLVCQGRFEDSFSLLHIQRHKKIKMAITTVRISTSLPSPYWTVAYVQSDNLQWLSFCLVALHDCLRDLYWSYLWRGCPT